MSKIAEMAKRHPLGANQGPPLFQKTEAGRLSAFDENKKHLAVGTFYTNALGNASLLPTAQQRFLPGSKNCIGDGLKLC